ncbi:DegT/DnrJ/EryC1/StrS family aminotransferase [Jiangella anatolica]|uniref:Glutamine--scyllo-inositol aminotransferase n=1 Tax=Jiangella anatolica TaxID=2670374 RepID=A0A2W2BG30_9ACTN|nr:DegT/DnrJ/EryC1/StrS family aminotransferase [Jiangella anatolica]PZF84240.1 glutamine--scyllo-inositol aminotransferase [Jiangella anatolica]
MSRLAVDGGTPVRTTPLPTVLDPAGRTFGAEERAAVLDVLDGAVLNSSAGGPWLGDLEATMARLHGVPHAVASSSGTAALHLAVAAIDPEPGDEIITTPLTDFGTIAAILAQNAVPVFADVDPLTGNLDPASVEAQLSERTRAILVVHLFGAAAPVTELRALADRAGVALIEDCAQAYLARPAPDAPPVGTYGAVGCFSLQQYKHVTAGDGGLCVTSDAATAERMRLFSDKAWPRAEGRFHRFLALNYRMTNLTAAVAAVQLRRLPDVVERRRRQAARLLTAVGDLPGAHLPDRPDLHAWWVLPLVVDEGHRRWAKALTAEGVPAHAGWLQSPVYRYPVFTERRTYGTSGFPLTSPPARRDWTYPVGLCPRAERLIDDTLVVLQWNENYADADVDDIAAALTKVAAGLTRTAA